MTGIYDSGLGGLTAYRELKRLCPDENIIYLGDTAPPVRNQIRRDDKKICGRMRKISLRARDRQAPCGVRNGIGKRP